MVMGFKIGEKTGNGRIVGIMNAIYCFQLHKEKKTK